MQRALVTGGAGFVGRHFCRRLLTEKWRVTCVDSLEPGSGARDPSEWPFFNPLDYKEFEFIEKDCRLYFQEHLNSGVERSKYDVVFHLAAIIGGRINIEQRPLEVAQDLAIDAMFFSWATKATPGHVVYFSSSAAYPVVMQQRDQWRVLAEDMISFEKEIGVPDLSYGWAKLTGEFLGRLAHERHGLNVACYRPFSGYGEDQDPSYPMPGIVARAMGHRSGEPFEVWGSGRQLRDFIHIDDCVEGVMRTYRRISDGAALNLSTGDGVNFLDLAQRVLSKVGMQCSVAARTDRPEGVFARVGCPARQRQFGLTPSVSLDVGLDRMIAAASGACGPAGNAPR